MTDLVCLPVGGIQLIFIYAKRRRDRVAVSLDVFSSNAALPDLLTAALDERGWMPLAGL